MDRTQLTSAAIKVVEAEYPTLTVRQKADIGLAFADSFGKSFPGGSPSEAEIRANLIGLRQASAWMWRPVPTLEQVQQHMLQGITKPEDRMATARACSSMTDPDERLAAVPHDSPILSGSATRSAETPVRVAPPPAPTPDDELRKRLGDAAYFKLGAQSKRAHLQYLSEHILPAETGPSQLAAELAARGTARPASPTERMALWRESEAGKAEAAEIAASRLLK